MKKVIYLLAIGLMLGSCNENSNQKLETQTTSAEITMSFSDLNFSVVSNAPQKAGAGEESTLVDVPAYVDGLTVNWFANEKEGEHYFSRAEIEHSKDIPLIIENLPVGSYRIWAATNSDLGEERSIKILNAEDTKLFKEKEVVMYAEQDLGEVTVEKNSKTILNFDDVYLYTAAVKILLTPHENYFLKTTIIPEDGDPLWYNDYKVTRDYFVTPKKVSDETTCMLYSQEPYLSVEEWGGKWTESVDDKSDSSEFRIKFEVSKDGVNWSEKTVSRPIIFAQGVVRTYSFSIESHESFGDAGFNFDIITNDVVDNDVVVIE